jgi:hypothetical protein
VSILKIVPRTGGRDRFEKRALPAFGWWARKKEANEGKEKEQCSPYTYESTSSNKEWDDPKEESK